MRKNMRLLIYTSIFIVGFLSGTLFGFKRGPIEFDNFNSQYKASIVVYENEWLKQGRVKDVIDKNEIIVNGELAKYGYHLDSNLFWLIKITGAYESDDESIKHAVNYRLKNPYQEPDMASASSWREGVDMNSDFVQSVIQGQKDNQKQIQKVIDLYGAK